jgi:hypothetical protein
VLSAFEFRQFVHEQHAVMGKGYFTGLGEGTAADQGVICYCIY